MIMTKDQSEAEDALARVLAMAYARAQQCGFQPATDYVARDEKILRKFMFGSEKKKGE